MNGALKTYTPFFASALLMYVVLFIIYPHYQYYIDPDGTAYLTIAQRYANGYIHTAINGYWSPWSCWLTALLIKSGISAIPASIIINTTGATGYLFISQSFFVRFGIERKLQWLFAITLALFLCYAIFWQSFDDLWECFFLLSVLRIIVAKEFVQRPALWLITGFIGALAYFAKAYSFPFFILQLVCCTYFLTKNDRGQWLRVSLSSIAVMVLCSLPWIYLLHNKYSIWTTSSAGTLNTSWYLVGHPQWKTGIDVLIPPAYKDSPYYWEDPFFANGDTPHFWDSFSLMGKQVLRIGLNLLKLLKSMLQLSVSFPAITVLLLRYVTNKKARSAGSPTFIITLSFLLFPFGYLLVNFEPRYIWFMVPLSMIAGGLFIQNHVRKNQSILAALFAVTYLVYPIYCMIGMYNEGATEYRMAQQLKQMNIHGTFSVHAKPGLESQKVERLAYFSGNQFYSNAKPAATEQDILREMHRYNIQYYFVLTAFHPDANVIDENGLVLKELISGRMPGLRVYRVNAK